MGMHESYYEVLYAREVVRLSGYAARHRLPGTFYAYLAYGGATLSAKDALAQGMLAIAQEKGFLKPGQTVVECSAGQHWPCAPKAAYRAGRKTFLYHRRAHRRRCPRAGGCHAHRRVFFELFRQ